MTTWHPVATLSEVSIIEGHRGYEAYRKHIRGDGSQSKKISVTLDGVDQKGAVISADAVEGWVHRTKLDEDGQYMHDGKEYFEETVRGEVSILVMEPN